ncbi:MAG: TetR/AcrR family transcriptional regulator [Erysipelotrichaceae bacterium]|nr:TetR/AcrR family transcriptional regulator [Erysipelotrichaceae bacterium]
MKEDLRVIKTKDNIKNSMLHLLKKYEFKDITMSMLVDECRINKTTFYRHYSDKYDLIEKISKDYISLFSKASSNFENGINEHNIDCLIQFFDDNKDELLILESKILPINIFEEMLTIMTLDLCTYFKKYINQDDLIKLYASLISNNILTTIKWYHKNFFNFERNQIIQIVLQTVETGLKQSITAIMKSQKKL